MKKLLVYLMTVFLLPSTACANESRGTKKILGKGDVTAVFEIVK